MATNTKEYNRLWRYENKEKYNAIQRRHYHKYPEKMSLYNKLRRLRASGKLLPQSCEICGDNGKTDGHHDDYSYPYIIRWLCPYHHKLEHINNE